MLFGLSPVPIIRSYKCVKMTKFKKLELFKYGFFNFKKGKYSGSVYALIYSKI